MLCHVALVVKVWISEYLQCDMNDNMCMWRTRERETSWHTTQWHIGRKDFEVYFGMFACAQRYFKMFMWRVLAPGIEPKPSWPRSSYPSHSTRVSLDPMTPWSSASDNYLLIRQFGLQPLAPNPIKMLVLYQELRVSCTRPECHRIQRHSGRVGALSTSWSGNPWFNPRSQTCDPSLCIYVYQA